MLKTLTTPRTPARTLTRTRTRRAVTTLAPPFPREPFRYGRATAGTASWLGCAIPPLTKVERRCVLRVTLCRCADPAQAADAAEELLALASVFLRTRDVDAIGGDALARARWARARRGVGAASTHVEGRRLAWRFWSCYTRA